MNTEETATAPAQEREKAESGDIPTPGPDLNRAIGELLGRTPFRGRESEGYILLATTSSGRVVAQFWSWDDYSGSDAAAFRLIVELNRLGLILHFDRLSTGMSEVAAVGIYSAEIDVEGRHVETRVALCRAAWLALTARKRKGVG